MQRSSPSIAALATALAKAQRSITVEAVAIIPLCSAVATALRTCTILVPALATEVALLSQLYRSGVLFSKLKDV